MNEEEDAEYSNEKVILNNQVCYFIVHIDRCIAKNVMQN